MKIALAGNPNCGKTTLFNDLTGSTQYVGNWPGVTVEKKEGRLIGHKKDVILTDLPGIYSLSPYSPEEVVSRNYLLNDRPDAVLNLVDGTNLERNLYLTTQLVEIGLPVVIALNMIDLVKKSGDRIDVKKLSSELGCPIFEMSALKGEGSHEAAEAAIAAAERKAPAVPRHKFSAPVEAALAKISELLPDSVPAEQKRFYSIKVFEGDEKILAGLHLENNAEIRSIVSGIEQELDDDGESIITNERYEYIGRLMKTCVHKRRSGLTLSDKIDRVVTNRIAALPIFVAIMFLVYYVSVTTVGTYVTDFTNDQLFGDDSAGWHLFKIGSADYDDAMSAYGLTLAAEAAGLDADAAAAENLSLADAAAQAGVDLPAAVADAAESEDLSESVAPLLTEDGAVDDALVAETAAAAPVLDEPSPADFGIWVPSIYHLVNLAVTAAGAPDWLSGLILDGIVTGVGSVLGFVPQMFVLFFFLSILEDCGYMARVAFIMDRIFRQFGLSGKSFIPMLISSGCGVPGVMATKTIENEKDRRMTIMTTTFIPCGAKLPIIALLFGALAGTEQGGWVAPLFYFLGIAAVVVSGILLKKTKPFAGDPAPFVMELPQYHMPAPKGVLIHMWERVRSFIIKAGTVIFGACVLIWFLSNFGWQTWAGGSGAFGLLVQDAAPAAVNVMDYSLLAIVGNAIKWIFAPLGFDQWQAAVATISGLIAKENVVSTFGVLFGIGSGTETDPGMWQATRAMLGTTPAMLSFLAFNLLCAPCFAAMGAIKRQMESGKWFAFAILYECAFAYAVALLLYQFGTWFTTGVFSAGTVAGLAVLALLLYLLLRPNPYAKKLSPAVPA